jgi:hypothetical protein
MLAPRPWAPPSAGARPAAPHMHALSICRPRGRRGGRGAAAALASTHPARSPSRLHGGRRQSRRAAAGATRQWELRQGRSALQMRAPPPRRRCCGMHLHCSSWRSLAAGQRPALSVLSLGLGPRAARPRPPAWGPRAILLRDVSVPWWYRGLGQWQPGGRPASRHPSWPPCGAPPGRGCWLQGAGVARQVRRVMVLQSLDSSWLACPGFELSRGGKQRAASGRPAAVQMRSGSGRRCRAPPPRWRSAPPLGGAAPERLAPCCCHPRPPPLLLEAAAAACARSCLATASATFLLGQSGCFLDCPGSSR